MRLSVPTEILVFRTAVLQTRPTVPYAPSQESALAKGCAKNQLLMAVDHSFQLFPITSRQFGTDASIAEGVAGAAESGPSPALRNPPLPQGQLPFPHHVTSSALASCEPHPGSSSGGTEFLSNFRSRIVGILCYGNRKLFLRTPGRTLNAATQPRRL